MQQKEITTERIPTGIEGLDELLTGGLIPGSNLMIEGSSGTGKSTIAIQFLLAGIERGEPGIYITLEEPPSKTYRDALSFGWDLKKLESEDKLRIIGTSPTALIEQLKERGLLIQIIHDLGVRRVVIDTITMLQSTVCNPEEFRENLRGILTALEDEGASVMVVRDEEPAVADVSCSFWARHTVDAMAVLSREWTHDRLERRVISVFKARGQESIPGKHGYKITNHGVQVYARVLPPLHTDEMFETYRCTSGISALDKMLGGGLTYGEPVLVSGPTGSGKTTLMLDFLYTGCAQGEPGLLVTTEETPDRVIERAKAVGFDIRNHIEQKLLDIEYIVETEVEPDEFLYSIRKRLEMRRYKRVGIDSLNAIDRMSSTEVFATDAMAYLVRILVRSNVTPMLSYEMPVLTGQLQVTHAGISGLASTVILLRLVEIEGDVKKGISILKHRGSAHATEVRQLVIDQDGIRVMSGFEGYQGVLTGVPVVLRQQNQGI